jgi:hypothetical protein
VNAHSRIPAPWWIQLQGARLKRGALPGLPLHEPAEDVIAECAKLGLDVTAWRIRADIEQAGDETRTAQQEALL